MAGKKKFRRNISNLSKIGSSDSVTREFTGDRKEIMGKLPVSVLTKTILHVGYLEKLICETPVDKKVNAGDLLKNVSGKKNLVCASSDGRLVLIISGDTVGGIVSKDVGDVKDLKSAIDLYTDFHGNSPKEIKKVSPEDLSHLEFFGWLKHIVYKVPKSSERAWPENVPYIHTAGDRGDDLPKAKKKPIVCFSPNKDLIVMYGEEMSFTDRGIIG